MDNNMLQRLYIDKYDLGGAVSRSEKQKISLELCNSGHIVKCYQKITTSYNYIFVLQFCYNGSLHNQIKQRKQFPVHQALAILMQIIIGLSELHKNKITHRCLKTSNIMLNDNKYKISDVEFILANPNEDQGQPNLKMTMAPQVISNQKFDYKADIWSLGIIFYDMICSNIQYQNNKYYQQTSRVQDIFEQITKKNQLQFDTVDGKPDQQLKDFIKSMLKVDQDKRISLIQVSKHRIFMRCKSQIFTLLNTQVYDKFLDQKQRAYISKHFRNVRIFNYNKNRDLRLPYIDFSTINQFQQTNRSTQISLLQQYLEWIEQLNICFQSYQISKSMSTSSSRIILSQYQKSIPSIQSSLKDLSSVIEQMPMSKARMIQLENGILMDQCYLEYLKSVYIFNQIIVQLQTKGMLNLKNKKHLQLLYLLITRCYLSFNHIQKNILPYRKHQDFLFYNDYYKKLETLYKIIIVKWQKISTLLQKLQNKMISKLRRARMYVFQHEQKKRADKFFKTNEMIQTQQQLIIFTQEVYISQIFNQLKGQPNLVLQMRSRLQSYQKINQITKEQLYNGTLFSDKVKNIVAYNRLKSNN